MRPTLPPPERVVPYLDRMHKARLYSNFGPLVRELEARLAERLGVDAQRGRAHNELEFVYIKFVYSLLIHHL